MDALEAIVGALLRGEEVNAALPPAFRARPDVMLALTATHLAGADERQVYTAIARMLGPWILEEGLGKPFPVLALMGYLGKDALRGIAPQLPQPLKQWALGDLWPRAFSYNKLVLRALNEGKIPRLPPAEMIPPGLAPWGIFDDEARYAAVAKSIVSHLTEARIYALEPSRAVRALQRAYREAHRPASLAAAPPALEDGLYAL